MIQDILPHKFSNAFCPNHQEPKCTDVLLCYKNGHILLEKDCENFKLPAVGIFPKDALNNAIHFFTIDDVSYFGFRDISNIEPFGKLSYQSTNILRSCDSVTRFAGVEGYHLFRWYFANQFCGCCGEKTNLKADERAVICPNCQSVVYPRLSPAVIVAVTNGNKLLMAKNANNKVGRYGLVAGFVEFGESLEETVRREVSEEVGLRVKNVKYFGSQPWGFSESLMIGFTAEIEGDPVPTPDMVEIIDAKWVSKEELPPPMSDISIGQTLINNFAENN